MALFGKIMGKKKKSRKVVIGIDGVPHSLLTRLFEEGVMPNFARMAEAGYFGRMEVTVPEISSISWTSFATGTNSGTHGIYGFMDLKPSSYDLYFPNSTSVVSDTLWDAMAARGERSVVMNLPGTYPARDIEGILIAGFVAIKMEKAITPEPWIEKLKGLGYKIDIDTNQARTDADFLFGNLDMTLEARERAADILWEEDCGLFVAVVTGTDRLQHFAWPAVEDADHPDHGRAMDYYRKLDGFIGRMYERYQKECDPAESGFFVLSDHGFCRIRTEVYLNNWLAEKGYLKFAADKPKGYADLDPSTRAFAIDPSRIYIHRVGRYPSGCVKEEEVEGLRAELSEKLMALTYDPNRASDDVKGDKPPEAGSPVFRKAFTREELYSGPLLDRGPDLVLLSHHGFDLKGALKRPHLFGRSPGLKGMHTQDDAVFFSDKGKEVGKIFDVRRAVLG